MWRMAMVTMLCAMLAPAVAAQAASDILVAQSTPGGPQLTFPNPPQLGPTLPNPHNPQPVLPGPEQPHCVCTMEYDPVCARRRDGTTSTFPNACHAHCVGATVLRKGPC